MRSTPRIPGLCLAASAFFLAVACSGATNEAFDAYKSFVVHLATGRHDLASQMCASQTARNAVQALAREHSRALGQGEEGTIHHIEYVLNSVDQRDGGVRLDVMLEMRMSPPGAASGFGTTVVEQRHIVELTRRDDAWQVADFDGRIIPDWGDVFAQR